MRDYTERTRLVVWALFIVGGVLFFGLWLWGGPQYRVWSREMRGKAALAEAQWDKKIQVEEALANLESEKLNAQSEVERAKGAAEAIEIEDGTLTEEYIRYLWVRQQDNLSNSTVIYIPTEAGLPILEAGRAQ